MGSGPPQSSTSAVRTPPELRSNGSGLLGGTWGGAARRTPPEPTTSGGELLVASRGYSLVR
eukprot:8781424-Pyramimonas_sp.AAC.4